MQVLDLFSGIGGFSLGLERAGHETIAFCEIEPQCRKVLDRWWPSIPVWEDIKTLNYSLRKVLKSSAGASHAKIYQQPASVPDFPGSVVDSGGRCYEPFAWYDRSTQSWRTWQRCLVEGWEPYSGTWPIAGMTRNGVAYQQLTLGLHTSEDEYGLYVQTLIKSNSIPSKKLRDAVNRLPTPKEYIGGWWERKGKIYNTPTANDGKNITLPPSQLERDSLIGDMLKDGNSGLLNPRFVEWLMGFPDGHTACLSASAATSALGNAVVPQIPELIGHGIA